jgi:two-component system chemotaxis sensor kinase CheA
MVKTVRFEKFPLRAFTTVTSRAAEAIAEFSGSPLFEAGDQRMVAMSQADLTEFLGEADETLERLGSTLTLAEGGAGDDDAITNLYRDVHTLKGSAQLFGCAQLAQVAHAIESSLEPVRSGAVLTTELVDATLAGLDLIRSLLVSLRAFGKEADVAQDALAIVARLADITSRRVGEELVPIRDAPAETGLPVLPQAKPKPEAPKVEQKAEAPKPVKAEAKTDATAADPAGETIRVQVGLLDSLMNLVGELVLIRNQVIQAAGTATGETDLNNLSQRLNVVTTELQTEVMKTRMQPVGNILSKFQRTVRDMARDLGKRIELALEGTETELDRTLVEAVKDPLTHIVRNSADHGLEGPDERIAGGKPATGTITIRAYHEGGQVVVEVADDGRGLSRAKIAGKAVERGLIKADAATRMSDREIQNLIFAPGFSTAEKVSNISGRGVGMDVVRTNIEKIGGMVDLASDEGKGTTIRLKIPLTLAIVPALLVHAGGERFAIPQVKLVELVRTEFQLLQGEPVFRLRGELLPLVSLGSVLGLDGKQLVPGDVANIAVLNADAGLFGLIVDSIEDSTDIVVKPLGASIKNIGVYSGATVLGDGAVALVLDVVGLAARARVFEQAGREQSGDGKAEKVAENAVGTDVTEFLLVDIGAPGRYAIPLCLVTRLEEVPRASLERSGDQRVLRYRGAILPVIGVPEQLGFKRSAADADDKCSLVVVERGGRHYGLEVARILDVIATDAAIDPSIKDRPAILGAALHADGVVVVIDAFKLIETAYPGSVLPIADEVVPAHSRNQFKVLLAEDNGFFRKHIAKVLTEAGFQIAVEVDGELALRRLQGAPAGEFALVLSDIEMPRLTGLELAKRIRADGRFGALPLVALTTRSSKADEQKGREAGFDKYLAKLDPEKLVEALDKALGVAMRKGA